MDDVSVQRTGVAFPAKAKCDICRKGTAEWFSVWSKGRPSYILIAESGRCPEGATKYCGPCKDIYSTRFRP